MPSADSVFLDTSGLIALVNADDPSHASTNGLVKEWGTTRRALITTDWVLAETGNGLARTPARRRFVEAVGALTRSPNCRIIRVDAAIFDRALEMYAQVQDKSWGLVDCASFIVMRVEGIRDALTSDQHFVQAGFKPLLATPE